MSDDHDQQQGQSQPTGLPRADGPLFDVTPPDGQHLHAVVKARGREPDGWWYDLQIHVPSQSSEHGRLLALLAAVNFRAPADLCAPVDGQPHHQVPTMQPRRHPGLGDRREGLLHRRRRTSPGRTPRRLPRRPRPHPTCHHRAGPHHPQAP